MTKKISIITVNLNNAIGLRHTIESVISQTYTNYEFIIIDGGSTDGSVAIIEMYSKLLTFWVSEVDKGIYNGMNKGVAKATGDFLIFLNSGDSFYSNNLLEEVAKFTSLGNDIIYGNVQLQGNIQNLITSPNSENIDSHDNSFVVYSNGLYKMPKTINDQVLFVSTLNHQSTFFRREMFIKRKKIYNEDFKIAADYDFLLWCYFKYKANFQYTDIIISNFDCSGISTNNKERVKKENDKIKRKYYGWYYWWIRQPQTIQKINRIHIILTHPKYTLGLIIKFLIKILPNRIQKYTHNKLFKH
jgi:glycosyltransferase involved in cell wall biosynthesis